MDKIQLENKSLHELRGIGRELGVKRPTNLTKQELILNILGILSGEITPFFTTKGRPAYKTSYVKVEKKLKPIQPLIEEIDDLLTKTRKDIIALLKSYFEDDL